MRIFLDKDVVTMAKERIKYVFDEFDNVVVNISGGKDSTTLFYLTLEEAKKRQRPIYALFIDQEVEWTYTIEHIREMVSNKFVVPLWVQTEFELINASEYLGERNFIVWEKGKKWIRDKEPNHIEFENRIVSTRTSPAFYKIFDLVLNKVFGNEKVGVLVGLRAEESLKRYVTVLQKIYKDFQASARYDNPNHYRFFPLYDWRFYDVWKYIFDNKLPYNRVYPLLYACGVPLNKVRVSALIHETSYSSAQYLPIIDVELYQKFCERIPSYHSFFKSVLQNFTLPPFFSTWLEYLNYLIDVAVPEDRKKMIVGKIKRIHREAKKVGMLNDNLIKRECMTIIANDWDEAAKLRNIERMVEVSGWKKKLKSKLKSG